MGKGAGPDSVSMKQNWLLSSSPQSVAVGKLVDSEVAAQLANFLLAKLSNLEINLNWTPTSRLQDEEVEKSMPSLREVAKADGKTLVRLWAPRSTRWIDAYVVFSNWMLPCTLVPLFVAVLLWWHLHNEHGWPASALCTATAVIMMTAPLFYSKTFRKLWRFSYVCMARYMKDVKIVVPAKPVERAGQPHILGLHPHGRHFYTCLMLSGTHETWRAPFLQGGDFFVAAAGGLFYVPFIRHWLYTLGGIPASKESILRALRNKDIVAIQVGGVAEVCQGTFPDKDLLYLNKRKGFARLAIEEQVGVIPAYCFSENQLFQHEPQWKMSFWRFVNRYLKIGVPIYHGILGLPMPYRRELLTVIGDPVYPKEGETVDEFHARYVDALQNLFKKYVAYSENPNHQLVIV